MQTLDDAKQRSTLQLLFKAARLTNEAALARVRAATGQRHLRAAHTALFPHIDLQGTRLTEIARRVGVSKQAVAKLVDELVTLGVLERVPDPSDGRAKLVRFAGGGAALLPGLAVLQAYETELLTRIDPTQWQAFRAVLLTLIEAHEG